MDRRKSLKAIALGSVATGVLINACNTDTDKKAPAAEKKKFTIDRAKEELIRDEALMAATFFNKHEMATITVLADIIIPKDDISGSASEAGVPDFIEFIVKDMPQHQTPMRGGLKWLDLQMLKKYDKPFIECTPGQQIELIDQIAYPKKAKPQMQQGVAFFSLMRNLTASGFYTSPMGVKDLGYAGNAPNKWNGVPDEVLKQYNMAYTEKEMNECAKYDS